MLKRILIEHIGNIELSKGSETMMLKTYIFENFGQNSRQKVDLCKKRDLFKNVFSVRT